MLDIFLYISIFISGTVFGSFFSLAVYRLPRKEDITHVRSHCTTCNHNLNFWDLIPVWSYVFLGGKCRYCKEKIRPRYILLEIFSGLVFVMIALSKNINCYADTTEFINLFFTYLFMCAIFIIAGIDKERYEVHDGTLLYGAIIGMLSGLFNSFLKISMMDKLVGFILIPLTLLIIDELCYLKNNKKELPIGFGDIKFIAVIGLFTGVSIQIISLVLATIISSVYAIIKKSLKIPFAFFISIATVLVLIFQNYIVDIIELINMNFNLI